jgi:hypothetical protein
MLTTGLEPASVAGGKAEGGFDGRVVGDFFSSPAGAESCLSQPATPKAIAAANTIAILAHIVQPFPKSSPITLKTKQRL